MGFSVYGRIGGNKENMNDYGRRRAHFSVHRNNLMPRTTNDNYVKYNPKTTAKAPKEINKNKFWMGVTLAATAVAAYKGAPLIQKAMKGIGSATKKKLGPTIENISKKTVGEVCKAPVSGIKKLGGAIAKPFVAIGGFIKNLFTKKAG